MSSEKEAEVSEEERAKSLLPSHTKRWPQRRCQRLSAVAPSGEWNASAGQAEVAISPDMQPIAAKLIDGMSEAEAIRPQPR